MALPVARDQGELGWLRRLRWLGGIVKEASSGGRWPGSNGTARIDLGSF
jgi:hypothetical protein